MRHFTQSWAASESVQGLIHSDLQPLLGRMQRDDFYPADFLRQLGQLDGYGARHVDDPDTFQLNLPRQLKTTAAVGRISGTAAFLVWSQSTCGWYLQQSTHAATRERYLASVVSGRQLAGSGISNGMKHLAGIEPIRLHATQTGKGWEINGSLPWVSNLRGDHLVFAIAEVKNAGYVMFAQRCDAPGVRWRDCAEFAGMRGSGTINLRFKNVAVDHDQIVATPDEFSAFVTRFKPGFMINQAAMGFGTVQGCIDIIAHCNTKPHPTNAFLVDQADTLTAELEVLENRALALASGIEADRRQELEILQLRAAASELALRSAEAAVLHAGARGYFPQHAAQRLLQDAIFVAIVTPALKHLRKVIQAMQTEPALCSKAG